MTDRDFERHGARNTYVELCGRGRTILVLNSRVLWVLRADLGLVRDGTPALSEAYDEKLIWKILPELRKRE